MAIAKDDRLQNEAILPLLPNNWTTLYELTELDEDALRNAVNDNLVNENMSHGDAKKLKSSKPSKKSVPKSDGKFVKKLKSTSPPRSIKYELKNGDYLNVLKNDYPENHFDSIVCDPPYGIEFLGKIWDKNVPTTAIWEECLRALKPGGYLLAFSSARTYHRLAIAIEDAGFLIKDQCMWIYTSGFPKAYDIGQTIQKSKGVVKYDSSIKHPNINGANYAKSLEGEPYPTTKYRRVNCTAPEALEWQGWKTILKSAHEPIVMAQKPISKPTIYANVLEHRTGALNIDDCRISFEDDDRFPSNVMFHPDFFEYKEHQFPEDYQKYFFVPKVSRKERNIGFEDIPAFSRAKTEHSSTGTQCLRRRDEINTRPEGEAFGDQGMYLNELDVDGDGDRNTHPTVKPIDLMQHLVRLVTPPGRKVLDPFMGNGSTGLACVAEGFDFVGIEQDEKYVEISKTRIRSVQKIVEEKIPANSGDGDSDLRGIKYTSVTQPVGILGTLANDDTSNKIGTQGTGMS